MDSKETYLRFLVVNVILAILDLISSGKSWHPPDLPITNIPFRICSKLHNHKSASTSDKIAVTSPNIERL